MNSLGKVALEQYLEYEVSESTWAGYAYKEKWEKIAQSIISAYIEDLKSNSVTETPFPENPHE